jgi:hypothetical protein
MSVYIHAIPQRHSRRIFQGNSLGVPEKLLALLWVEGLLLEIDDFIQLRVAVTQHSFSYARPEILNTIRAAMGFNIGETD